MNPSNNASKAARLASLIIAVIFILLPFHAFLAVWLSSGLGQYTLLRLWNEILLIFVLAAVIYILAKRSKLRRQLFRSWLVRLIAIYTTLILLSGFIAYLRHDVTAKALAYGALVDLRFYGFFLFVLVVASCSPLLASKWRKLLLYPSTIVVVFAILQYLVLPFDFLRHFGYGPDTISPYETINHNINHLRVESTLRGANPLGAYLVLIISAVAAVLATSKNGRWKKLLLAGGAFLALVFTYSRSAWIGVVISAAIIVWLALKTPRLKRWALIAGGLIILIGGISSIALRHNTTFEDDFLHTDHQSQIATTSNQGHSAAFKNSVHDIGRQPLGGGTGTAGPASNYNNHQVRLAENYFLQIGQEAGILGMGLFIAINLMVGRLLWLRRADPLALALLASLVGLTVVNLLSHAWTDDTLAYLWWGLAGVAIATPARENRIL